MTKQINHGSKAEREHYWNEERKRQTRSINAGEQAWRAKMEEGVIHYDLNTPEGKAVAAQCTHISKIDYFRHENHTIPPGHYRGGW